MVLKKSEKPCIGDQPHIFTEIADAKKKGADGDRSILSAIWFFCPKCGMVIKFEFK